MNLSKPLWLLSLTLLASACDTQPTPAPGAAAPVEGTAPAAASATGATESENPAELSIVRWGANKTQAGEAFNVQPDGKSGMWFQLSSAPPLGKIAGTIGGKPLISVVAKGNIVAGTVPADYLSTPGTYPVVITIATTGQKIEVGNFIVE